MVPVEHSDGIGGHFRQGVGSRCEIHAGGPPCVAMVEPDHLPSPRDKRIDQLIGPSDPLR